MKRKAIFLALVLTLAAATAQEHSPLASGRWWKLTVEANGMYGITTADLAALRGVAVEHIGVYGADGTMLPTRNAEVPTMGLRPVASEVVDLNANGVFDDGDRLLFFGEATDTWRFNADTRLWEFVRNAYASANHYFLGIDVESPLRIATAEGLVAEGEPTRGYTAVAVHDTDMVSLYQSGQKWMGERMSAGAATRHVSLDLPSTAYGTATLRYGIASMSTGTSSFNVVALGYSATPSVSASAVYSTFMGQLAARAGSTDVSFTYLPYNGSSVGYIDFVELTAPALMQWDGTEQHLRTSASEPTAYRLGGGSEAVEVWEVYAPRAARRMATTADAQGLLWADTATGPALYAAFLPSAARKPKQIASLTNQDLHGSPAADMVVVSHADFLGYGARVATAHELFDTLQTIVVSDEQVFNEYSSGKADPMAIRTYMRHLREAHPERPVRYLLLVGKATYDHRNIEGNAFRTVVTYQTPESFDDDGLSYCSDDMMGYLDANETGTRTESIDIGIGRLPVNSAEEAERAVDKIEAYLSRRDLATGRGDWRNTVALLADDADPSKPYDTLFAHSSEIMANNIAAAHPEMAVGRFYADAYRQQSGAIGSTYPDLNNALRQQLAKGCLIFNYVGHGSTNYIGTERYLGIAEIESLTNYDRWPLVVASTCSYGRFDRTDIRSGAESFLLSRGGAIAVVSASRPISHSHNFDNMVLTLALDGKHTIGDALRLAKNANRSQVCIGLVGDPALRLSLPEHRVELTAINRRAVCEGVDDTATVLSEVLIEGEIRTAEGELISDFEGMVYPVVYDRPTACSTLANDNPGTEVAFQQQKNILYKGAHPVSGGHFSYSFVVPRDVAYRYDYGKISHYAQSGSEQASGAYLRILFGGLDESDTAEHSRPEIALYMGDTNFRNGGLASASPTLLAHLWDEAGINAVGSGIGHDITAMLDNNPGTLTVLNDLYQPDLDDNRRGTVRYNIEGLTPGRHTLTLKAWNIYNLSGTQTISFVVPKSGEAVFASASVSPNPATDVARFSLETAAPDQVRSASLDIYSAQGQLMLHAEPQVESGSYVVGPVVWNCGGAAPGVYVARFAITTTDGELHHYTTKCIVK